MRSPLFLILTSHLLVLHHGTDSSISQQHIQQPNKDLKAYTTANLSEGDVINGYSLHQRLDFLGVQASHVGEDSSFLLERGSSNSPTSQQSDLTRTDTPIPNNDISLFKQAFRINKENIDSVKKNFHLNEKVFFGGHGEVWLAHKIVQGEVDLNQTFVLKRMNLRNRPDILRCALREIYFGELLRNDPRTTHLIAHFLHQEDYWLAFEDEGVSLQQLLYAVSFTPTATLLEPSAIWRSLRSSKEGDASMKSILYQIIKGVENLHSKGILHRDIKPSNLLINAKNKSGEFGSIRLLVSDYSSAVSEIALRSGLYGALDGDESADGTAHYEQQHPPSVAEESPQYTPPEVTFSCFDFDAGITQTQAQSQSPRPSQQRQKQKYQSPTESQSSSTSSSTSASASSASFDSLPVAAPCPTDPAEAEEKPAACVKIAYDAYRPESYDIWSIGVVFAEMILGTADVFSVDPRTAALIKHRLRHADLDTLDDTLTLAALADFCIYVPDNSEPSAEEFSSPDSAPPPSSQRKRNHNRHRFLSSSTACDVHHLAKAIQRRDPLGIGYHAHGIDLLHRLLKWRPTDRITLQQAMLHAYFVGPYVSTVDGSEHMTAEDMKKHDDLSRSSDLTGMIGRVVHAEGGPQTSSSSSSSSSSLSSSTALTTSNPSFQLATTVSSPEVCAPMKQIESFTLRDGFCDIAEGVRNLMADKGTDNEDIFNEHILSSFRSRFYNTMKESWRGNIPNISKDVAKEEAKELNEETATGEGDGDDGAQAAADSAATTTASLSSLVVASLESTVVNEDRDMLLFECPKCRRVFPVWESCHRHISSRKHGSMCNVMMSPDDQKSNSKLMISYTDDKSTTTDTDAETSTNTAKRSTRKAPLVPAVMPSCLSSHALLDIGYDPSSGWCDLQGRRAYLEDTHAIRFEKQYKFFGVFDGHMGNRASKFVARHLQSLFHMLAVEAVRDQLNNASAPSPPAPSVKELSEASVSWQSTYSLQRDISERREIILFENTSSNAATAGAGADHHDSNSTRDSDSAKKKSSDDGSVWRLPLVVAALRQAFVQTNSYLERHHGLYPNDLHTGTTATVVLQFPTVIVVGNVGDSRAVLCCDRLTSSGSVGALALTTDHTPYDDVERSRIEALGGSVVDTGEKLRVGGSIAVTRSIGDIPFGPLLTAEPDISVFRRFSEDSEDSARGGAAPDSGGDGEGEEASVCQQEDSQSTSRIPLPSNPCDTLYNRRRNSATTAPRDGAAVQQFIVLASDGLFDVMTNNEVVYFVCNSLIAIMAALPHNDDYHDEMGDINTLDPLPIDAFHIAAKQLAQEAYVRGSTDNIGVCIINLVKP